MNMVKSVAQLTAVPMVLGSGSCFFSFMTTRAKEWINCVRSYACLNEVLLGNKPQGESTVLKNLVSPLEPAAEVDRECSVDIGVLFVAVWRWHGIFGGEL